MSTLMAPQAQSPMQYGQQPIGQQPFGQQFQQPFGQQQPQQPQQQMQQPFGQQQGPIGAQVVSDTVLRVVSASLGTVLEQLRMDQQALQTLCTQGQLSPQAYSNVLTEAARRSAPIVASAFSQIAGGGQQQPGMGQWGQQAQPSFGQQQQPMGYGSQLQPQYQTAW